MKNSKTALFTIAFILCSSILPWQLMAQDFPLIYNPKKGQELFDKKGCINCHAVYGFGGTIGSDLGRSLANKEVLGIVAAMWNHSNEMSKALARGQTIPQLSPSEMASLISFFYYLNYFGAPGSAEAGGYLFQTKGCVECHTLHKSRTLNTPYLLGKSFASPLQLGQSMWNHSNRMISLIRSKGRKIPSFTGEEIADLFSYLRGRNPAKYQKSQEAIPGNYNHGKALLREKKCLWCHSLDGQGGRTATDLNRVNFHRNAVEIVAMLWNHIPEMWSKMEAKSITLPEFNGTELIDLLAYLYFLDFRTPVGDSREGEKLFKDKQCNKCHSLKLSDKRIAPNLATVSGLDEMINISSAMWNHNISMLEQMKKQDIPFPRFTGDDLKNLLTFIRSVREREVEEE